MSGAARGTEGAVDERGNPFWTYDSPTGPLEITINLAKPEKDPRDIAAAAGATLGGTALAAVPAGEGEAAVTSVEGDAREGSFAAPTTCDLCWEPSGKDGLARLGRSGAPVTEVFLGDEPWAWWFSPYGYFPEHLIVASHEHRPMAIGHDTIARLLDFSDAYPQWFIGSNADLPIVGGSLLGHDHFQGGGHRFPLMNAPIARAFPIEGLEGVEAGIVRWPASVVRLRSRNRSTLTEAACRILDAWRPFTFEECGINAFSVLLTAALDCDAAAPGGACRGSAPGSSGVEGAPARFVQHNTANPILWREDDNYVMDIVLRNNRTTPERPFGLFHVPERLFHIKKENIGLIEIMGRAILPARLAAELPAIKDECSRAFYEILMATGVFKDDPAGRRGWETFLATI